MDLSALLVFWCVWLLLPLVVDGSGALISLAAVVLTRLRRRRAASGGYVPIVTVILPIYNSAETLEACLRSLEDQDYPHDHIEVLLVDNGSRDGSFSMFGQLQRELRLPVQWLSVPMNGKAWALNAGIHLAHGAYIFNIDSDTVLSPEAIWRVVERFEAEPDLAAVTGAIGVLAPPPGSSRGERALAACEWFEYLTAFQIGRVYQSAFDTIYTLSGAFSVFRRETLLRTGLYTQRTVTEDTDLTFELHGLAVGRVACVSDAVAYVHPIESLAALYAQRVRWQRGQIEVSARHAELMRRPLWQLRGLAPARTLLIDHTLAFPRLAWIVLLPLLTLFGYAPTLIASALIALYGLYLAIELVWVGAALAIGETSARKRLEAVWWALPLMPLYRMIIFWFRLSGFLYAVAEPGVWRVPGIGSQLRYALHDTGQRIADALARARRRP